MERQITTSRTYQLISAAPLQPEHGTRFLFSARFLQNLSFCHGKFPSNLCLTKYSIKKTGWASVSFLLIVLDKKKPAFDKQLLILFCYLHQPERSVALYAQGKETVKEEYTLQII